MSWEARSIGGRRRRAKSGKNRAEIESLAFCRRCDLTKFITNLRLSLMNCDSESDCICPMYWYFPLKLGCLKLMRIPHLDCLCYLLTCLCSFYSSQFGIDASDSLLLAACVQWNKGHKPPSSADIFLIWICYKFCTYSTFELCATVFSFFIVAFIFVWGKRQNCYSRPNLTIGLVLRHVNLDSVTIWLRFPITEN
jgi:hypothetical protein